MEIIMTDRPDLPGSIAAFAADRPPVSQHTMHNFVACHGVAVVTWNVRDRTGIPKRGMTGIAMKLRAEWIDVERWNSRGFSP
jgi:hypothetical protein